MAFEDYKRIDADRDPDIKKNGYPVFPAGSYCIADLCYLLDDNDYDSCLKMMSWAYNSYLKKDNTILGWCSTGDDGCYEDTLGRIYGVDAGNISIVPTHLVSCKNGGAPKPITFKNDFQFFYVVEGVEEYIHVKDLVDPSNSFKIFIKGHNTDSDDEDEDEEDDEIVDAYLRSLIATAK